MTDVVAVALISAGSSLLGAAVGAVTTYKISLRNSETTIAAAEAQKAVELAKIEAENSRLREQHQEEKRRNRQETYHQALTVIQRVWAIEIDSEDVDEVTQEWRRSRSGVQIFGSKEAFEALDEVQEVLVQFPGSGDSRKTWQEQLSQATYRFIEAVRKDVQEDSEALASSRGAAPESSPTAGARPGGGLL
jgi:hypothetical protein